MKKIVAIFFVLFGMSGMAQINYVLNPSFEVHTGCPNTQNQAYLADYWSGIDSTALFSNCNSDYYNSCSSTFGFPNQYFLQTPKTGNAMFVSGFYIYDSLNNVDFRDWLQGTLHSSLTYNNRYCVKFHTIYLNTGSYTPCNKQCAYLDDGGIDTVTPCQLPMPFIQPQLIGNNIVSDSINWTKIEGSFIAQGNETKITIGNFFSHSQTSSLYPAPLTGTVFSVYGVDDVSVVDYNLPAFAGTDALIATGDSVYLGRPNEIGPECRWLANGLVVDSNLGFWAKPTQPTQYVLQQKICGNVKYDTVFVNISGHDGLNDSRTVGDNFKLLPNPNNGSFIISSSQATYNNVVIYSVDGKEVYNNKLVFTKGNANFDLDLPNGVYQVKLIGSSGVASQKLVISK